MKFQVGDLVRPDGHWPPNSRLGCIDLALVVGVRCPKWGISEENKRVEIQILAGHRLGHRVSTWDSTLQKVEK